MSKNLILLLLLWLMAQGSGQAPQNKPQPKPLVINRVTVIDATGADITNTQKINAVVTGGKLIDRAALQAMLAQAEAAARRQ
jgi:hypothetical protein